MAHAHTEDHLRAGLAELGVAPTPAQIGSLTQFLALLEKWNRAFNLSGIRDPDEMVVRHVLDSVTALPWLHGLSILDVGTGAGLPGLPLAILDPQRQFTLLDSGGKKIRFVRHAIGELALNNVSVVQQRVEDFTTPDPFDTVLCRAFASLGAFVRSSGRLVANGGRLVAMKGRFPEDELAELPADWQATDVAAASVPGLAGQRHVVVVERTA